MGGGAILRTTGRVIGMGGGVGFGGERPSTQQTCGVGKASWSTPKVRTYNSCCVCEEEGGHMDMAGTNQKVYLDLDLDLWDHPEDVHKFHPHHSPDHLIFGLAPTLKEVEEATSYLRDALKQAIIPFSGSCIHETPSSSSPPVQQRSHSYEVSNIRESEDKTSATLDDWIEPVFHQGNRALVQNPGHINVYEAFHMLQTNPAVQNMVTSVASDKAVWESVLKNEKVEEFRQSLHKDVSNLSDVSKDSKKPPCQEAISFIQVIENTKGKAIEFMEKITELIEFMEKITELINNFLGYADNKILTDKDGDLLERTLKASLMLSVAALLVVMVKRGQNV
eukprot:Gb_15303 [translate_table: standard]